jgi:hypothetical protein
MQYDEATARLGGSPGAGEDDVSNNHPNRSRTQTRPELTRGQRWRPSDGNNIHRTRTIDNVEPHFDLVEWTTPQRPTGSSSRITAFHTWIKRTNAVLVEKVQDANVTIAQR